MITQKELKKNLRYYPDSGIFTWKKSNSNMVKIGDVAGSYCQDYIRIAIYKKTYPAHRLAFLYMKGYFPENVVDHINRIKNDNRWSNLRHVSKTCNIINSGLSKNNTTGIKGVCWLKRDKRWLADIRVNRKSIHLGQYKKFTKAVYHRWKGEVKYGFPNCNSSSTSYLYLKNKGLIN